MKYSAIIEALRETPAAYETTGEPFWDDEHISESMLKAHLSPDLDGASRRHDFIRKSVQWIASRIGSADARILDLGCGPGLYARQFAEMGFAVTGVDFSRRSIAYAQAQAARSRSRIDYQYRNYLDLDSHEQFDAVMMVYCDFGVLPPSDRETMLRKICRALRPGGVFILDVFSKAQYEDFENGIQTTFEDGGFWSEAGHVCLKRSRAYDEQVYLEQYIVITPDDCRIYNLWNHAFTADELTADLENAGFTGVEHYGDIAGAPYCEASPTVCCVGKKR